MSEKTLMHYDGDDSLQYMMKAAVEKGPEGVETLERLMALQERLEAKNAKAAFVEALSQFQADVPTIVRSKVVPDKRGQKRYAYAPLEHIVQVVGPTLRRCGFSWQFTTSYPDGETEVCCTLRHAAGHEESSCVRMPQAQVIHASPSQLQGATVTYGRRIAFINALGLVTADEDVDGADIGQHEALVSDEQVATLDALLDEVKGNVDINALWRWVGGGTFAALPAARYADAVRMLESKR